MTQNQSTISAAFRKLHALLDHFGLYYHIRYSRAYHFLLRFRNPAYIRNLIDDEVFYRSLWKGEKISLIFDVGSNVGDKAYVFARLSRRVVCFEPDPRLAERLRIRFRRQKNVEIVQAALSRQSGTFSMHAYDGGSAYNTLNTKQHQIAQSLHATHQIIDVPTITLDEEFKSKGIPDFLKVDVEGHEEDVFSGMSHVPKLLSLEANLPEFAEETCRILIRLATLDPNIRFAILTEGVAFDSRFSLDKDGVLEFVMDTHTRRSIEIFARAFNTGSAGT